MALTPSSGGAPPQSNIFESHEGLLDFLDLGFEVRPDAQIEWGNAAEPKTRVKGKTKN